MTNYIVSAGVVSQSITLGSGDQLEVLAQGTANGTIINSGGIEVVFNDATAFSTDVQNGGTLVVLPGARVYNTSNTGGLVASTGFVVLAESSGMVVSSGAMANAAVDRGDTQYVLSGASATNSIVSGGTIDVYSGGVESGIFVSAGLDYIYSGATARGDFVFSAGSQFVSGTASATTLKGGYQYVRGTADDTIVSSGSFQVVSSGGITNSTRVDSGGTEILTHGADSIATKINNGGYEIVASGGVADGTIVSSGGFLVVSPGGQTSGDQVLSGGVMLVASGGTASATMVSTGGSLILLPGAIASGTTGQTITTGVVELSFVGSNATLLSTTAGTLSGAFLSYNITADVLPGGVLLSADIAGHAAVFSGGEVSAGFIINSGSVQIRSGGTASGMFVQSGTENMLGASFHDVISSGGTEFVHSNGVANYASAVGGTLSVYSGGVTVSALVENGGDQFVATLASASATRVASGGYLFVDHGGSATDATVSNGGAMLVVNGGSADGSVIDSGGVMFVMYGGTASDSVVSAGGRLIVLPGGTANATTGDTISTGVILYRDLTVLSAATNTMSGSFVSYGVIADVLPNGELLSSHIAGQANVFSGGVASADFVVSNGSMQILSGGTASRMFVQTGTENVLGESFHDVVSGGGIESVQSNGEAYYTSAVGGVLEVYSGGLTLSAVVESGGVEIVENQGNAGATSVTSGGSFLISSGGGATGVTVLNSGTMLVLSGGSASGGVVDSGGLLVDLPGGTITNVTSQFGGHIISGGVVVITEDNQVVDFSSTSFAGISAGGDDVAYIWAGGNAVGGTIEGIAMLYSGGVASGLLVTNFGALDVGAGAVANAIVLSGYGYEVVSSGGIALDTTLDAGPQFFTVYSGGITSDSKIGSGGTEYIYSGGVADGSVVSSGGTEFLNSGAIVSGLVLDLGAMIELPDLAYTGSGSTSLSNDVLTITQGAESVSLQLAGNYSGTGFAVTSNGFGGTLVTEVPCYCRGTHIRTDQGEMAIEDLREGDLLITASGEARPIRWIGQRGYDGRFIAGDRNILPILITAGALDNGVPARDLLVSPLHALFLDGALIPAWVLANGSSIRQIEQIETLEYFHLELDSHDVILAEGAAAESFVDDGGRGMFVNADAYRAMHPDATPQPPQYCAPRLESGDLVDAVLARLKARAQQASVAPANSPRVVSLVIPAGSTRIDLPPGASAMMLDGERREPSREVAPSAQDRWCHIELMEDQAAIDQAAIDQAAILATSSGDIRTKAS